ncbi:MAG: DUF2513 domain-containing protein [Dehalococcoidia bacterium]|nr:DUF2513 domain-containing protein [Dehalococcoidia bacterium]
MKRKMKLIRKILEFSEEYFDGANRLPVPEMKDYSDSQIEYHVRLCLEAGYLRADTRNEGSVYAIYGLTWQGHELLDQLRQ